MYVGVWRNTAGTIGLASSILLKTWGSLFHPCQKAPVEETGVLHSTGYLCSLFIFTVVAAYATLPVAHIVRRVDRVDAIFPKNYRT